MQNIFYNSKRNTDMLWGGMPDLYEFLRLNKASKKFHFYRGCLKISSSALDQGLGHLVNSLYGPPILCYIFFFVWFSLFYFLTIYKYQTMLSSEEGPSRGSIVSSTSWSSLVVTFEKPRISCFPSLLRENEVCPPAGWGRM